MEGRPVYVERGGTVDVEAMFLLTNIERLVEYHTFTNEVQMVPLFNAASAAKGKPVTTLCAIVDMGGMSTRLATSGASAACPPRIAPVPRPSSLLVTHPPPQ